MIVSGDFLTFQQDSAPAHRARDTVRLLEQSALAFIPQDLWPPNSTDLNLVGRLQDMELHPATSASVAAAQH